MLLTSTEINNKETRNGGRREKKNKKKVEFSCSVLMSLTTKQQKNNKISIKGSFKCHLLPLPSLFLPHTKTTAKQPSRKIKMQNET